MQEVHVAYIDITAYHNSKNCRDMPAQSKTLLLQDAPSQSKTLLLLLLCSTYMCSTRKPTPPTLLGNSNHQNLSESFQKDKLSFTLFK